MTEQRKDGGVRMDDAQEPDDRGTTDAEAGMMEADIPAEPPRSGAERHEPTDPAAPARQAADAQRAEETASGLRQGDAPARQEGGEDELGAGRDVPTAEGEEVVRRGAGSEDAREDQGWSQPESSAQKLE